MCRTRIGRRVPSKRRAVSVAAYRSDALLAAVYWTIVALTKLALVIVRRRLLPDSFGSGRSPWLARTPARRDPVSMSSQQLTMRIGISCFYHTARHAHTVTAQSLLRRKMSAFTHMTRAAVTDMTDPTSSRPV